MTEMTGLYTAVMVIGYVILGLLTVGVVIKIASVYARYKESKKSTATIELKDNVVLAIAQEQGEATILCKKVENLPQDSVVIDGAADVATEDAADVAADGAADVAAEGAADVAADEEV
jgi:hypothetical protein